MKIVKYAVALTALAFGVDYLLRKKTGKGFFTSERFMAEYVNTYGKNNPLTTDAAFQSWFENAWLKWDKKYRHAYFKAAWKNQTETPTPTFIVDGKTYYTKGGLIVK